MVYDGANIVKLGIVGYPLGHSASPHMYNRLFAKRGIRADYQLYQVKEDALSEFVARARDGMKGFNVTIPYKRLIVDYLDALDRSALEVGAVNTVENRDSMLIGYNTDITGFSRTLDSLSLSRSYDTALIIGAGGAARSLIYPVANIASRVIIASKSGISAISLANSFSGDFDITGVKNDINELKAYAPFELIVNASPVGMKPNCNESPIPASLVKDARLVVDLVYNPLKTKLISMAEDLGVLVVDGLWMLVYQAVENLKIWLGLDADPQELRSYALEVVTSDYRQC